jgi:hypothetical protein
MLSARSKNRSTEFLCGLQKDIVPIRFFIAPWPACALHADRRLCVRPVNLRNR